MARPVKKEVVEEAKKKPIVVESKSASEKPSPAPSKNPLTSANPFALLDEDSSDLIGIVDANGDDAFVAVERKRIEEEKKAAREAKMKAREEEKKAEREAKKKALLEKKAHDASILRFHTPRPNPGFSKPSPPLPKKESQGGAAAVELEAAPSVDGGSSISSEGRRRANVNGSLRRKQKKKKAQGEGDDQQDKQVINAAPAPPVGYNNYPRSYTLKEYEERKKKEEEEKHKKPDPTNNGMDQTHQRQQRFDNGGQRRYGNGGQRRYDNGGQRNFGNGGQRTYNNGGRQAPVEEPVAKFVVVNKPEVSFSMVEADFLVLGQQVPAVRAPAAQVPVAGKAKKVAGKAMAKQSGAKKA